ncbi:assimilatory nitrate reductase catalytic subunit [Thalassobacillus pellis]|nr:assimilatory nitrate reductase catalytic subunit [Thalassobacillus pellis]
MKLIEQKVISRNSYKAVGQENPTSRGRLCIKGMNAHQHVFHNERITEPLLNVDGEFIPIGWEEALEVISRNFATIQREDGPHALSVYGSASLTNEEAYLLGKFARVALKTKHIDYNGRYCMSSAASAANQSFGIDRGLTNPLQDISHTRCIILAGTNIAECQPTIMPYFEQAKENGAFIIAVDPRETATTRLADLHLQNKPGTDVAVGNALLKVILGEGLADEQFLKERVDGYEKVVKELKSLDQNKCAEQAGIPIEYIYQAARIFASESSGMIFTARGIEQQIDGTEAVCTYINILLATGKIGKPYSGFGAVTGQGNGQGAREHGQKADQLPGYRSIEDKKDRQYIAKVWGVDEKELPGKGVSAYELFERASDGAVTGMLIMGSNPVISSPHAHFVTKSLKKLKFLVTADLFLSETSQLADLVLPAASYIEDEGTMTNIEGRVTLREASRPLPGEVRRDWQIICDIAKEMGTKNKFSFKSAEEVFEELRIASKGGRADYSGITYERIRKESGILWPCYDLEHKGTERLFEQRFAHENGKARMIFTGKHQVTKGEQSEEFPLLLTNGRVMAHYLTGEQTRRSSSLEARNFEADMQIHPETARRYNIPDETLVKVESQHGKIIARSKWSTDTRKDTIFVPFHWGKRQTVNRMVRDDFDPTSLMPGFKRTPVRINRLE